MLAQLLKIIQSSEEHHCRNTGSDIGEGDVDLARWARLQKTSTRPQDGDSNWQVAQLG